MESKPSLRLLLAVLCCSLIAVGFSGWGWVSHKERPFDAAYLALKSTEGGEAYERAQEEFAKKGDEPAIEIGRFAGLFVDPLAFAVLFLSLSGKSLTRFMARRKSGHVVVVGESLFADKLGDHHNASIVHLRGIDDEVHQKGRAIRLPFGGFDVTALRAGGAARAAAIIIAPENDAQAIDLGMAAQHLYPKAQVSVRLHDYWLAERLHNTPGAERLSAISEPCLAARFVVRSYPPFLVARDAGQARIHALLIGDHDWLEAVMAEIILSACTLTFGKPVFSFICDTPHVFSERLVARYPELDAEAELHFYPAEHLDEHKTFLVNLQKVGTPAPVTAVYSLFKEGAESLSAALTFVQAARQVNGFAAPVFVFNGGLDAHRPKSGSRLAPLEIVSFGNMTDLANASGLLSRETEIAEREFHSTYLTLKSLSEEAAAPWDELKEEYRVSNRRAVGHIYAKLFDAGFDLRPWMAHHNVWLALPALAEGEALYRNDAEKMRLAELEHVRWMADRRMSGWRYGVPRDEERKLHPDIKAFDRLTEATQASDLAFIDVLGRLLKHGKQGMVRYG